MAQSRKPALVKKRWGGFGCRTFTTRFMRREFQVFVIGCDLVLCDLVCSYVDCVMLMV